MKVLFLAPPLTFEDTKIDPRCPPEYLAYAAAYAEADGHDVSILDAFMEHLTLEAILARVREVSPDLVLLAPYDYTRETPIEISYEIAEGVAKRLQHVRMGVVGSMDRKHFMQVMREKPCIEFATIGEYEETIRQLLRCDADSISGVPGLLIRSGDEIVATGPEVPVLDLDKLPYPAWHLLDFKAYTFIPHRHKYAPVYPLMAARGCPFQCKTCKEIIFSKIGKYRLRSVPSVISEIRYAIEHHGAKEIQFIEQTFGIKKGWVIELCEAMEREGLDIPWSAISRVDVMDRETLRRMGRAGCWNVLYGVESSNSSTQSIINKNIKLDRVRECVRETRDAGIKSTLSYMFGLPGETPQDALDTIQFSIEADSDFAQYFLFKYYTSDKDLDRFGSATEDWDMAPYGFRGPIFIPHAFKNKAELQRIQKLAYRRFYLRPRLIRHHLPELTDPKQWMRFLRGFRILMNASMPRRQLS